MVVDVEMEEAFNIRLLWQTINGALIFRARESFHRINFPGRRDFSAMMFVQNGIPVFSGDQVSN